MQCGAQTFLQNVFHSCLSCVAGIEYELSSQSLLCSFSICSTSCLCPETIGYMSGEHTLLFSCSPTWKAVCECFMHTEVLLLYERSLRQSVSHVWLLLRPKPLPLETVRAHLTSLLIDCKANENPEFCSNDNAWIQTKNLPCSHRVLCQWMTLQADQCRKGEREREGKVQAPHTVLVQHSCSRALGPASYLAAASLLATSFQFTTDQIACAGGNAHGVAVRESAGMQGENYRHKLCAVWALRARKPA